MIVRGNNWTRSVGLDGWHWLVLTNGVEVKLQRNALSVLKPPTGLEEDGNDFEDGRSNIEENRQPFKTRVRPQKPSCFARKWQVAYAFSTAGSKFGHRFLKVNLSKLETDTLLRYWKRFKLVHVGPHSSKQ